MKFNPTITGTTVREKKFDFTWPNGSSYTLIGATIVINLVNVGTSEIDKTYSTSNGGLVISSATRFVMPKHLMNIGAGLYDVLGEIIFSDGDVSKQNYGTWNITDK